MQQLFVCNWSSIYLRTNYRVRSWSNILESFITILHDFEKQWLSSYVYKAIVIRPVPQKFICLVRERNETFWNDKKCKKKDLIRHMVGGMVKKQGRAILYISYNYSCTLYFLVKILLVKLRKLHISQHHTLSSSI